MYVYIVIVMLNMSLDGCNAPESLFISQLWHASLSDERDGRLGGYCPTDIVSGGNARGSQQKNFFFLLQKFKAKLDSLNDTGLPPGLKAVRAST